MKVAHFNFSVEGGAAIAARRIHDSLLKAGLESRYYFCHGQALNSTYIPYSPERCGSHISKLARLFKFSYYYGIRKYYLEGRPHWVDLFSFPLTPHKGNIECIQPCPDVVHLHWIGMDFIDYPSFFSSIPDSLPIVWTLHDMNPFTGGCHYSWECDHFRRECGNCFQLGRPSKHDVSHKNLHVKFKCLRDKNIHIVADSYWLEKQAKDSHILSHAKTFQTIHYGLDIDNFYPKKKLLCKELLGIDTESVVIGFGAHGMESRRKGLPELMKALPYLEAKNITLLTFGGRIGFEPANMKSIQLGFINSPELLSLVYSACDMFIIPSLHEAFGQTSLESMACGTPVVGFDVGGIPDMVLPGETGLLAKRKDEKDLAEKIQWMLDNPDERERMGINCRELVVGQFTLKKQAEKYISLYNKL